MNIFPKKSIMVMLTTYMSLWLVVSIIAGVVLDGYANLINATLGLKGYRVETSNIEGEDLEYFKSDYVKYNEDGSIMYITDEDGYTHQVYDDAALRKDALEKANQVQREGTTILWNNVENGLPLEKGDKVSLFGRSSVSWMYSGSGSGGARTNGAADMKKALTSAGLSVNETLLNFYKSGEGKNYVGKYNILINEAPWSLLTTSIKNSFASYGDAAIITLSRYGSEGYGDHIHDLVQNGADTPSGDYLDLSQEERDIINEVIALKKAGTFKKVIILLNTPTDLWLAPLLELKDDIDCCMWVGQTGYQGLNEVGKILVGDSIPSGHLVDTFLMNTRSNPALPSATMFTNAASMGLKNLGFQGVYNVYLEGIYVGYKYYETRYEDAVMGKGNASSTAGAVNSASGWSYSEEVAFPFGYGWSYTSFEYSNYEVKLDNDGNYVVSLVVKNTGNHNGADAVQVYVQKPYSEYDIEHGIEEAAVNLVGYAKTPELKPGESVNIAIVVRSDALKTYDAYNQKTYIREAGDYYITVAENAHAAVNNILAAKGYTPENTNGVMDAEGNTALVEALSFDKDDFETYSVSKITGKPITNQFDNADWNLYENRPANETVTYMSRNDWQATYPTSIPKLSLTKEMVEDLAYNHTIVEDPTAKMPLYGQPHVFNLIDLKGVDYNHSSWDTLLDQLTFDEMISLLGTAFHGTKAITSIAKPAELTKDGPLGVRIKYLNSNEYTLSYPSTTILAASYNDQLAYEVGQLMGEDMLHAGITGIYGPGSNIHRNSYAARNWEYYSEDGFISGMMGKWQVKGIQSKGCYVNMKHFVLNDQETRRHGICTFANEQAIREIFLAAYEYAVTEADCTGIMTGFNRMGTTWTGAHKGLCTEVLRGEWGFEGFVISDCEWMEFMGVVDGVLAGNDCILTNIDLANYESARTSPTGALAVREAVHHILYVTVNSNAMNGISSNTKIIEVEEWWQILVKDVQKTLAIIVAVLLVLTILTLIFKRSDGMGEKNIIVTIVSFVVAVAMVGASIAVPIVLNKLPMNFMSTSTGGTDDEVIDDGLISSKFEAECSELVASSSVTNKGTEGKGIGPTNYPSGDAFIHNLENSKEFTITFRVHSPEAKEAILILCMGRRENEVKISNMFNIDVNGEAIVINEDAVYSIYDATNPKYYDWTECEVATVQLKEGENVITLTRAADAGNILNLDYIALKCDIELKDYREVQNGGHTYSQWTLLNDPTFTDEGKISSYCETCRNYIEEALPAISEEAGYTKTVISSDESSMFEKAKWTYTGEGYTFEFIKNQYSPDVNAYIIEAENGELGGDSKKTIDAMYGASGGVMVGNMNNNNASITIKIHADKAGEALLILNFGRRVGKDVVFNDGRTLTLNNETISVPSDVVFTKSINGPDWFDWGEFDIVTLNLKKGINTITLTNNDEEFGNIDYFKFVSASKIIEYVEVEHDHIDSDNDFICDICDIPVRPQGETQNHNFSYEVTGYLTYDAVKDAVDASGLVVTATCPDCSTVIENALTDITVTMGNFLADDIVVKGNHSDVEIECRIPALTLTNYTSETRKVGGPDYAPVVNTVFTSADEKCVVTIVSDNILYVGSLMVSQYDYAKANTESARVTYDPTIGYIYEAISPESWTSTIRSRGIGITFIGDITFTLEACFEVNNNFNVGTVDKPANITVVSSASNEGIMLWDGADMYVAEGSALTVTGSSNSLSIRANALGSYITIDGTVTTDKTVSVESTIAWEHPDKDNYNLNPTLYIRKGTLTVKDGGVVANMLQVGSLKNGYRGTLNITSGDNAISSEDNGKAVRFVFSNGTLNLTSTAKGKTGIDCRTGDSSFIWFDAGMTVTVATEGEGTFEHFIGEYKNTSQSYRVAVHSDAKFTLPASTDTFFNNYMATKFYGNMFSTATININGEEKTVMVANAHYYSNSKFAIKPSDWLTVENADGSKSVAAIVPVEGEYTKTSESTYVSDWSFSQATYTDSEGTTHTIYYREIK